MQVMADWELTVAGSSLKALTTRYSMPTAPYLGSASLVSAQ